ncbi:MAG: hypothetical protein ABIL66_04690 [candidate division WOR-3 bacterium]
MLGFAGTYYFIKEGDVGNPTQSPNAPGPQPVEYELIEIESDSTPTPPLGFRTTTVDEIHSKGLLTPSESFALAQQQGSIDAGTVEGYSYTSWITTYTKNNIKHAEGGSRTGRTVFPGTLFILARNACVWDNNPSIVFPRKLHKPDSTYYQTWGWNTQWVVDRQYPLNTTAQWNQKGWHKYSGPQDPYSTNVTKQY